MGGGGPFVLGQLCLGRCEANPSRTHGCACPWWLRLMTLGVSPGEPGEGSYIWVKNQQSPLKRLWIKVLLLRALVVCMSVCAFSITPGIYLKGKPYQTCGTLRPWNINILQWLPSRGDWYSAAPPLVYSQAVFNVADMCIKKRLEKGKHFQAPLQCGFSFCLCPFFFFFFCTWAPLISCTFEAGEAELCGCSWLPPFCCHTRRVPTKCLRPHYKRQQRKSIRRPNIGIFDVCIPRRLPMLVYTF